MIDNGLLLALVIGVLKTLQRMTSESRATRPVARAYVARVAIVAAAAAFGAIALARGGAVDVSRLREAFRSIGVLAAGMGIVGAMGVTAFQSLRWWTITRPVLRIRYRDAFAAIAVGGFFNVVLPARAGDAFRLDDLSRRAGASRATLLGTELVDFVMDKAGWLPAFALLVLTGTPSVWMYRAAIFMSIVVVGTALAVIMASRLVRAATAKGDARGWRGRLTAGLVANSPRRLAIVAATIAACPWLWESAAVWGFARAGGLHLAPLEAFSVLTAFNVAAIVPVPGNLGMHEAASSAVLVSFGVPLEQAIVLAVTYHATQIITCVLGGSFLFIARRFIASRVPRPALSASAQAGE